MMEGDLDDSQRAAVEIEANHRQIVIAGPGAGKTEVVSALVIHLIEDEGIDASEGLTVLSFSNAAVHAIDARLRLKSRPPIPVQTIDSLAAEALRDLTEFELDRMSFEQRVLEATETLKAQSWQRLDLLQHLVVDEVQDVVGVRAEFLLALLRALSPDSGFTLLGDLAQGIYDFQLRADEDGVAPLSTLSSQALLHSVAQLQGVEAKRLTGAYRADTRDTKAAVELRDAVLTPQGRVEVDAFYSRLVQAGQVAEVVKIADRWPGTTAFLTATNGQALLVADLIARGGLAVELRRGAHHRVLAGWIALLLADSPRATISREEFFAIAAERGMEGTSSTLWRALRSVSDGRTPEVDVSQLPKRLAGRRVLIPALLDRPSARFVVSTVHRAKGLEFDNVVVVDFESDGWRAERTDPGEIARTKFVALTRARRLLVRCDGPDDGSLEAPIALEGLARRWFRRGFKPGTTTGIEIKHGDVDTSRPWGDDPGRVQATLRESTPGETLALILNPRRSTLDTPVYDIAKDGLVIAATSQEFGRALARRRFRSAGNRPPWPALAGARIESVITAIGPSQTGTVGRHGLWLAPEVSGMLKIDWKGL